MTDANGEKNGDRAASDDFGKPAGRTSGLGKLLLVLSIVLMIGGVAGGVAASLSTPAETGRRTVSGGDGSASGPGLAQGFLPSGDGGGGGGGVAGGGADGDAAADPLTSDKLDEWSPVIFKLGFSFFVGFAIAYALRTFLKISIVTVGFVLLVLFGLEYSGLIKVEWVGMSERFDSVMDWLKAETGSFKDFVTGHLPSAASATTGLVFGFRKR